MKPCAPGFLRDGRLNERQDTRWDVVVLEVLPHPPKMRWLGLDTDQLQRRYVECPGRGRGDHEPAAVPRASSIIVNRPVAARTASSTSIHSR